MTSSSTVSTDHRFTNILARLLRPPLPGCIFIQATAPSDQINALHQIRQLTASASHLYSAAELHPNLLGSRVIDLRRDLHQAFLDAVDPQGHEEYPVDGSGPTSAKIAATTFCNSISVFPRLPGAQGATAPRVLIIPSAQYLRSTHAPLLWSQFLHPPPAYTVVAISSIPLYRWRSADAVEQVSGVRPIVTLNFKGLDLVDSNPHNGSSNSNSTNKAMTQEVLFKSLPPLQGERPDAQRERFKLLFVEYVFASLSSEVGPQDVEELCFLTSAIWLALARIVMRETDGIATRSDAESTYKDRHSLLRLVAPLVRGALRDLLPRKVGLSQWINTVVSEAQGRDEPYTQKNATDTAPLPPLASLMAMSAFLASHLPPRTDTRYFLRDSSLLAALAKSSTKVRRSKKRSGPGLDDDLVQRGGGGGGGTTSNSDPLLLGPKPFVMQRMLYIFENLCTELDVRLPSFQRGMLSRRKRRRKEEQSFPSDEEEAASGQVRGKLLFPNGGPGDLAEDSASKVDLASLSVQHALSSLVQAGYLVFVGPSMSGSLATSIGAGSGRGGLALGADAATGIVATGLPPIPCKLEAVTQVTMRCNVLKEELRALILGEEREGQQGELEAKAGGAAEVRGGAQEAEATMRKEWWTRLEECGL